jgi:carbamoyltransferase
LCSPFEESAILTIDGVGEWTTTAYGIGKENKIELSKELRFPHSLGLLYSAFTYFLGFKVNSDEYKVMGLSPYGKPIYYDLISRELVNLKKDGSFKLNMKYFAYAYGLTMTNENFAKLFGIPPRNYEDEIKEIHQDIAASIQKVTEEIILRMCNHLYKETKLKALCLAGGVALNCVANGKILRETPFENLFIQPGAGDAGGAVGSALLSYYSILNNPRNFVWETAYLGPEYSKEEIVNFLLSKKAKFKKLSKEELIEFVVNKLIEKKVVGWFQGKMEFGPRALGNRSILADPRDSNMKDKINTKVKFRESFRPFAPAILEEKAKDYFEINSLSPYMLFTFLAKEKAQEIPAVVHIDNTSRLQTVSEKENKIFYELLTEFYKKTNCSALLNTSFNIKGEPIVCSPEDAYNCFLKSGLDVLVMGDCVVEK